MLVAMNLARSEALVPRLRILPEATSTNDVLTALAAEGDEPNLSTVITLNQTGGRGRLGRTWVAPAGASLAASVLLRPAFHGGASLGVEHFGWLPLIAGAAMCRSVDALIGDGRTGLKWPNDVHLDGLKVCGVLAELLPGGDSVVIGAGVNLTQTEDELPVSTATSLALAGVLNRGDDLVDAVLGRYLAELTELLGRFLDSGAEAAASGIQRLVSEWCATLGQEVRVQLPGDNDLIGTAMGIDETGRLLVRTLPDGRVQAVAAGDVTHLRYE
jgi:BirA family biotin operon repressor/biotin-[acetyl-CoA-carboxylase] ligase